MNIEKSLDDKINKFIEKHKEAFVKDICDLVSIKSVAVEDTHMPPYGEGCRQVLDKALEISKRMGFEVENHNYYCGTASLKHNSKNDYIGFWGHLDVVPEGEGWTFPPYEPTILDGYIIGRGSNDNKGASICALYTLLFFLENQYNLNYNYKVVFGTNEENGMDDVEYFIKHCELPVFSIIADSVFPICYAEKGIFTASIEIPLVCDDIIEFRGGAARNAVPNSCEITINNSNNISSNNEDITVTKKKDSTVFSTVGKAAHASSPEGSINAIGILSTFMKNNFNNVDVKKCMTFISNITSSFDGSSFGIKYNDGITGDLTCVVGMVNYENDLVTLSLDIRYPIKTDVDTMIKNIEDTCVRNGARLVNINDSKSVYVDPNDKMVCLLNDLYNSIMDSDIPPYYEGGGSYARKVPNSLAFGPVLHKRKQKPKAIAHGGAHKSDESMNIEEMLQALKIYIVTVLKLDKEKF